MEAPRPLTAATTPCPPIMLPTSLSTDGPAILNGGAGFTMLKKGTGITSVMIEIGLHTE